MTTVWLVVAVVVMIVVAVGAACWVAAPSMLSSFLSPAPVPVPGPGADLAPAPTVYVVHAQPSPDSDSESNSNPLFSQDTRIGKVRMNQQIRPDLYPEPVQRLSLGIPGLQTRTTAGPITQVGILTAEGGSSGSAAPDRTILPLYGRELDARRGRWNYYTRTDGTNPVQVPVRVRNRVCDDDTNGCDEIGSDDSIHVPALGRAFTATVYRKSIFG